MTNESTPLRDRAQALGLHGLADRWDEWGASPWMADLIALEEAERRRRSLERRMKNAHLERFKPMADFDWSWPESIDRDLVEELFKLGFIPDAINVILFGSNGTGKTMILHNLAHAAIMNGYSCRFTTASAMLNHLASEEGAHGLQTALRRYSSPQVLVIDEVGYLSYGNRHADLLFEVISRRYGQKSTLVSTNKPFAQWNEVFPNAACVVTLVDRLIHHSEIVNIEGESYRLKEARERAERQAQQRKQKQKNNRS
jgi:DNA replication protein DnaC